MRNIAIADKWRLSLLLIFTLAGCDQVVKVETFPERATIEQDGRVGCTHPGYCVACGYDYSMKWHCGPAFRNNCPGGRAAVVKHIPARRTYVSGKVRDYTIDTIVLVNGACQ